MLVKHSLIWNNSGLVEILCIWHILVQFTLLCGFTQFRESQSEKSELYNRRENILIGQKMLCCGGCDCITCTCLPVWKCNRWIAVIKSEPRPDKAHNQAHTLTKQPKENSALYVCLKDGKAQEFLPCVGLPTQDTQAGHCREQPQTCTSWHSALWTVCLITLGR